MEICYAWSQLESMMYVCCSWVDRRTDCLTRPPPPHSPSHHVFNLLTPLN